MGHSRWIVALARIMAAVFRSSGDVSLIVDDMNAVFGLCWLL